jgi:hypothetical protein
VRTIWFEHDMVCRCVLRVWVGIAECGLESKSEERLGLGAV